MAGSAKNMFLFSLGLLLVGAGTFVGAGDSQGALGTGGQPDTEELIKKASIKNEDEAPKAEEGASLDEKKDESAKTPGDACTAQSASWFSSCTGGICNRVNGVKSFIVDNPFKSIFIFIGAMRVAQWTKDFYDLCCGADDASARRRRRMENIDSVQ